MNYMNPSSRNHDADADVRQQLSATSALQLPSGGTHSSLPLSAAEAQNVRLAELESLRAVGESIERLIAIFARLFEPSIPSPVERRASSIGFLESGPQRHLNDPFEESA